MISWTVSTRRLSVSSLGWTAFLATRLNSTEPTVSVAPCPEFGLIWPLQFDDIRPSISQLSLIEDSPLSRNDCSRRALGSEEKMAIVMEVIFPGLSPEHYDQLKEKVGWVASPPAGGISHLVWWEGDDCHGIDVWESEEAWGACGQERMGPAAAELGISIEAVPTFHQPHEVLIVKTVQIP